MGRSLEMDPDCVFDDQPFGKVLMGNCIDLMGTMVGMPPWDPWSGSEDEPRAREEDWEEEERVQPMSRSSVERDKSMMPPGRGSRTSTDSMGCCCAH